MILLLVLTSVGFALAAAAKNCDRCRNGFVSNPEDQRRCKYYYGNANNASLIISSFNDIRMIPLQQGGQNTTQLIRNGNSITGIDYNLETNTIFWFSHSDKTVYRAPIINGVSRKQSIIMHDNSSSVHGLAVDWIHNYIYWVDRNKEELVMSNLNGTMKKVLFNLGFQWPLSIAVNPLNGWMYWTDNIADRIERAGLDGSRREVIVTVTTNSNGPQGLAIDFVDSRLYWSQGDSPSSIWSSNFDGSESELVFTAKQSQLTGGGDFRQIAVFDKYVFFVDWETDAIRKVDKCNGQELEAMYESILWDMKIYHPAMQPEGDNLCSMRIAQCSHLCFSVPSPDNGPVTTTTCACPDGLSLSRDQQTCVRNLKNSDFSKHDY